MTDNYYIRMAQVQKDADQAPRQHLASIMAPAPSRSVGSHQPSEGHIRELSILRQILYENY